MVLEWSLSSKEDCKRKQEMEWPKSKLPKSSIIILPMGQVNISF